jgi:hypothetical protein
MWCAYLFGIFDLLALPEALKSGVYGIVQWTASFFLQLVLLSIILVGQNIQGAASDKRAEATYKDAEAVLHECAELQRHLAGQDGVLERLIAAETSRAEAAARALAVPPAVAAEPPPGPIAVKVAAARAAGPKLRTPPRRTAAETGEQLRRPGKQGM